MDISLVALLICGGLLLIGASLGAPITIGLFAALPFGATAIAIVNVLGGVSPPIYTWFGLLFIVSTLARQGALDHLATVFARHWVPWLVCALTLYATAGALLLPRLFAGQTSALVPVEGAIAEVPLRPVAGNFNQTGYFALGALLYLALSVFLMRSENLAAIRRGFFAWSGTHAALGLIDLGGKLAGIDDVLGPIRSAGYTMLTASEEGGFWRVAGGYSEASAYGSAALAGLAFNYTYWRNTGSPFALILCGTLTAMCILSTSTTALVGLAVLGLVLLVTVGQAAVNDRLSPQDLALCGIVLLVIVAILFVHLRDEHALDPFVRLFEETITEKPASLSAEQRIYWNTKALDAFVDTGGVGIGMGSSRAASWILAVVSQLGVIGIVMMAALVAVLVSGPRGRPSARADRELTALARSARAAALTALLAASVAGGSADPGVLVFMALAIVQASRQLAPRRVVELAVIGPAANSMGKSALSRRAVRVPRTAVEDERFDAQD